jgi:putative spermidine/putrescine transport system permease protein
VAAEADIEVAVVIGATVWRLLRWLLLLAFAAFFAIPLLALLNFSTKDLATKGRTGAAWQALFQDPTMTDAITTSLLLALFTVLGMIVLLVPTMIWVRLRVPGATRMIEFLCLLPLTIPALVIVVGLTNVYAWVNYLVGDSALTLAFVYVVLVLPYAYRAIDSSLSSLDATTLAEAARSLGASWFTVITRVILPNLWPGVLGGAFIAVALVLGEFTISSLSHYNTLPVVIVQISKADAPESMAAALASLVFAAVLLVGLSFLDRRRHASGGK